MLTESTGVTCVQCGDTIQGSASFCPSCGTLHGRMGECEQHPDREARVACVVCGKPLCASCRRGDGFPALCHDAGHAVVASEWVRLFASESEFEGDCVARNLEARAIAVRVFSSRLHLSARTRGASDAVRVFVRREDAARVGEQLSSVLAACADEADNVD